MAGLRAFQAAPRSSRPEPMPVVHRASRALLRDYGGEGPALVFVPSLINPPDILDLGERSLLRWMATRGCRVWMVDWGEPGEADSALDLSAHVTQLLVPLIEALGTPPVLVGYCLGGTLATAAAALTPVAGLATLAAPWRFAGYGDARAAMLDLWRSAEPLCEHLGVMPMELLQAGFWRLDPARTIAKYEAFAGMAPESDAAAAFVRLEDWANAGPPLPLAAARQLFDRFVGKDDPGRSAWQSAGTTIDPAALACPAIEFVSRTDRIVPAATAAGAGERIDLAIGHVGMVVGGRARAETWEPLRRWISAATTA